MDTNMTMQAIGFTRNLPAGDPGSLVALEQPVPALRDRDLLVEVMAVSVNPVDVKRRANTAPAADGTVLGYDAAGVVRAVGDAVELFSVGDEVFYAGTINRPGSNSRFHAVDERIVGHKPQSLDFADAAALPLTSITAWEALFDRLGLHEQSTGTLLVVGASGGVGSIMLQLARELLPHVRRIGTASRPEAEEWVRMMGADAVVDHRADLVSELAREAPHGVDYLFTSHSEGQLPTFVKVMNPFGQIVAIDDPKTVDVVTLKSKSLSWHWELMFTRSVQQTPDMIEQHNLLERIAELVDSGRIVTTARTRLAPLDAAQLREAHRLVEEGSTIGKIVVGGGWPD